MPDRLSFDSLFPTAAAPAQPAPEHEDRISTRTMPRPTTQDVLRYRYHHGTNLGGIFVLEQWLFGGMYDEGVSGASELDAVVSSINLRGLDQTRRKWEAHWAAALTDQDLEFLAYTAHCNHIRLPIGYFTLGPAFCGHTAFAMQPAEVYVNAWSAVKAIVARCYSYGIGVLIDLHGVPGGANNEIHSGTSSGHAELWGNRFNLDLATECLKFIATEVSKSPDLAGVVGIQVCNEAMWDPTGMYEWYNDVIKKISIIDITIPVYLSDGWDLRRALEFTRAYNTVYNPFICPVVIDRHLYYTFGERDTSRSPAELTEQVKSDLHELDQSLVGNVFDHKSAVAVYIGEYSMALAPQSLDKAPTQQRDELVKQFGRTQCERWQEKASGSAFWTLKMDWMDGGGWGFKQQTKDGAVIAPKHLTLRKNEVRAKLKEADHRRTTLMTQAMKHHCEFWDKTAPGGKFEHWRFADGWQQGWSDARDFFASRVEHTIPCRGRAPGSVSGHEAGGECCDSVDGTVESKSAAIDLPLGGEKIGALDLWALKRMREAGVAKKEECGFGWEWEQGFRAGVGKFYEIVGI